MKINFKQAITLAVILATTVSQLAETGIIPPKYAAIITAIAGSVSAWLPKIVEAGGTNDETR